MTAEAAEIPAGARAIQLHGKVAAGRIALVDEADYDLVAPYRWTVLELMTVNRTRPHGPYAVCRRTPRPGIPATLGMHRLLTGWPLTDHINHDGLDNRRSNLREASPQQNTANSRKKANGTSRFKGVCRDSRKKAWRAHIRPAGKFVHLGYFADEVSAARAYDAAALAIFGEFAYLNFPTSGREPSAA
jgi:hypothetical protein